MYIVKNAIQIPDICIYTDIYICIAIVQSTCLLQYKKLTL